MQKLTRRGERSEFKQSVILHWFVISSVESFFLLQNEGEKTKVDTDQYEKRAMKGKEVMQARLNQELKR